MHRNKAISMAGIAAIAGVAILLALPIFGKPSVATITIDQTKRLQTLRGWEVSDRVWQTDKKANRYDPSWEAVSKPLAEALVREVGINNLRLQVPSGIENTIDNWQRFRSGEITYDEMKTHSYEVVNDNDDPMVLDPAGMQFDVIDQNVRLVLVPLRDALAAQGERLYVTLTFVDFAWTDGKTSLNLAENPAEYAEYVLAVFDHLQTQYAVVPDALEIILEPENTDGWSGRAIGAAIVAVTDRLGAAGYAPEIIAPSTTRAENAVKFFNQLVSVPGAAERVDMLAYHRYGPATARALPGISATAAKAGVQTGMLEFIKGDIDMLFEDLTRGNVSAWQQYGVARRVVDGDARASASYYLDALYKGDAFERIELPMRTQLLAQVFRLFRTGAVRVGGESDNSSVVPVAMEGTTGRMGLALRLTEPTQIKVHGMSAGNYVLTGMNGAGMQVAPQPITVRQGVDFDISADVLGGQDGVLTLWPVEIAAP